jgi:hypothetical protein
MENHWYWCEIKEADETAMPDFSKIPEEKRQLVKDRYFNKINNTPGVMWQLWGPQIELYQAIKTMSVKVVKKV